MEETQTLTVGQKQVVLIHPGLAHTHGDLWVHLPEENVIATGDLLFHTCYPFFDLGEGGVSVPDLARALRRIAAAHPDAVYLPGHGPVAQSPDLIQFADYLEALYAAMQDAVDDGLDQDTAVRSADLSRWASRSILPSFHNLRLSWATLNNNKRWAYQLIRQTQP